MTRIHKDYREGRNARFTNESKFWPEKNICSKIAQEAITEGENLRKMLSGKRVLLDISNKVTSTSTSLTSDRELKNAFRL